MCKHSTCGARTTVRTARVGSDTRLQREERLDAAALTRRGDASDSTPGGPPRLLSVLMVEPTRSYQLARPDGSEFTGEYTGALEDAAAWGAELATSLGWQDWQLEEREGRHVVAVPSATELGYVLVFRE